MKRRYRSASTRRGITKFWIHLTERDMLLYTLGTFFALYVCVLLAVASIFVVARFIFGFQASGFLQGLISGCLIGAIAICMLFANVVFSGSLSWMLGGGAEKSTNEILESLGPEWKIFSNIPFVEGPTSGPWEVDVDHVAVGPRGVLVVETKYTSVVTSLDEERLGTRIRNDAAQAYRNSVKVGRVVQLMEVNIPIIPVLVYWGPGVRSSDESVRALGSVRVVAGAREKEWMPNISSSRLDQEKQVVVVNSLTAYLANYVAPG